MSLIVVHENTPLRLPPELAHTDLKERLLRMSDESRIQIFRHSRGGELRAAAVVGTVTCGKVRIEIRPKTCVDDDAHDRAFLLNLLRFVGYLKKYHAAPGRVNEADGDPIEILIAEIARDIVDGLREGVPRRYEVQNSDSTTVRGRIDFARLSSRLPSEQMRVPIRHASLLINNRLASMIKWVAKALLRLTRSARTKEQLSGILVALRDVDLARFSPSNLETLNLSRFETRWERTLAVALLLHEGRSVNPTTAGLLSGIALVFKLHGLFERCLRKLLPAALPTGAVSLCHKSKGLFMLQSSKRNESLVPVHPDFVYRRGELPIAIADAKWKLLKEGVRGYDVDPADLYQAHAYMARYQVRDTLLLFPKTRWMREGWSETYRIPDTDLRVHLLGIDIESLVSPQPVVSARALESLGRMTAGFIPDPN